MTALHGFLGRPEDWDGILGDDWTKLDWLSEFEGDLDAVAAKANSTAAGDTLLAYSMGGRIALHMLLQAPHRWRRAIIVSASPGLQNAAERETRRMVDAEWARRFRKDDWDSVVADWNGQPIFAHDPPDRLPRREADFQRDSLQRALLQGSVATQRDLRDELRTLAIPILWIAGERDAKYSALAQECAALNHAFSVAILPDTGHRTPWGNPAAFREAVDRFITIEP